MDFTREPIIETVITPREGCKLVVRSSKSAGQEEYFVDALEVVSFGASLFFRTLERPKSFLLPVADYEVLEVREARMVLKNVGMDRSIKIGGGREANIRQQQQPRETVAQEPPEGEEREEAGEEAVAAQPEGPQPREGRGDKRRDRRRHSRRRRGAREEEAATPAAVPAEAQQQAHAEAIFDVGQEARVELPAPHANGAAEGENGQGAPIFSKLLPPPPTLISETIARYREEFKNAFYSKEEKPEDEEAEHEHMVEEASEDLAFLPSQREDEYVDEDASHPTIPPQHLHKESEGDSEELWNFSEELSNNQRDQDKG